MTYPNQIISSSPDSHGKNLKNSETRPSNPRILNEERKLIPDTFTAGPTRAEHEQGINLTETVLPAGELFGPYGQLKNTPKGRRLPKVKCTEIVHYYPSSATYPS